MNIHEHAGEIASAEPACDFLWGVAEIGQAIGRNPRQTFHIISKGVLKFRQKDWRSLGRLSRCPAA